MRACVSPQQGGSNTDKLAHPAASPSVLFFFLIWLFLLRVCLLINGLDCIYSPPCFSHLFSLETFSVDLKIQCLIKCKGLLEDEGRGPL